MVRIYGLPECGKCDAAKDKLRRFKINFEERSYSHYVAYHDSWKEDGSVEILAARSFYGDHAVPLIESEDGRVYDYPGFMRVLKQRQREHSQPMAS